MRYQVSILPVQNNQTAVLKTLLRVLGADQKDKAENLIKNGGTVSQNLNKQAATSMANQLRKLGVRVEDTTMQSEKSDKKYLVRLLSVGKNEIKVIKVVRELTGLGLKEAKLIVDKLGIVVENLSKNRAESIGRLLEAAGARVRIEEMSIPEPEPDPGAEDFKTIYANFTDESGKTLVKFNIDLYEENIQEWLLLFDRFKDRGEK